MRYYSLQSLRALAVLSVLILHSDGLFAMPVVQVPLFSEFGWIGVRLFFVISGFIVAERIANCADLPDYLCRRFLRVFPLYSLLTFLTICLLFVFEGAPFVIPRTDSGLPFAPQLMGYLVKSLFIVPQDAWPVLAVGWSLEFELIFYGAFGITYFLVGSLAARLVILVLAIAGLINLVPHNHIAHPFMVYFFAGCLCRDLHRRFQSRGLPTISLFLILSTYLWIAHLYEVHDLGTAGFIITSSVSFAALILLCLRLENYFPKTSLGSVLVRIGDASYSIYLCHWLLFRSLGVVIFELEPSPIVAELIRVAIIGFSVLVSIWIHKRVEIPLNRAALAYALRMRK